MQLKHARITGAFWSFVAVLVLLEGRMQRFLEESFPEGSDHVAVLVLLEVRMQLGLIRDTTARPPCCSPCFAGSSYATPVDCGYRRTVALWLQSLFCWKFVCNLRLFLARSPSPRLQSLFCWKFVCNYDPTRAPGRVMELQSLFCWKFVCNPQTGFS